VDLERVELSRWLAGPKLPPPSSLFSYILPFTSIASTPRDPLSNVQLAALPSHALGGPPPEPPRIIPGREGENRPDDTYESARSARVGRASRACDWDVAWRVKGEIEVSGGECA
jgi:hypothetical protein